MVVKTFNALTFDLFKQYGNRKQFGLISFFYDVDADDFIPVPVDREHADTAAKLIFSDPESLKFSPKAQKLIPIIIKLNADWEVEELLTGVSGMEIGFKVRHEKEHLELAHRKAIEFIRRGTIPISKKFTAKLVEKYTL